MGKHKGKVFEKALRKSGYSVTKLAKALGMSRNTIYARFQKEELSYEFILKVGNVIHYDFASDFPELRPLNGGKAQHATAIHRNTAVLLDLQAKHSYLLERYNKLFSMLLRLANNNELEPLKKEIAEFVETEQSTSHLMVDAD